MEFNDIRQEVKALPFETLRQDCDNYFEAVMINEELGKLNERLAKLLGEPAWPSKKRLPIEIQDMVKNFGGIMAGQTLYFKGERSGAFFAMLWPWQDGQHTTVKIIQK